MWIVGIGVLACLLVRVLVRNERVRLVSVSVGMWLAVLLVLYMLGEF